jgi:hypothetical protein
MKTIARTAVLSALLLGGIARAQSDAWVSTGSYRPNQTQWILNWEIAEPIGDFNKYISDTSFRGFSFEGRSFVKPNLSVGLSASFNRFQQTFDMETMQVGNATVSGPVYRYADMFALRALGHFYLPHGNFKPYGGLGIGGSWDYAFQQVADLSKSQSNFDFIVSPEIGLLYTVASGGTSIGLNVAIRYTYTTATVGTFHDAQTFSGVIGVAWGY